MQTTMHDKCSHSRVEIAALADGCNGVMSVTDLFINMRSDSVAMPLARGLIGSLMGRLIGGLLVATLAALCVIDIGFSADAGANIEIILMTTSESLLFCCTTFCCCTIAVMDCRALHAWMPSYHEW